MKRVYLFVLLIFPVLLKAQSFIYSSPTGLNLTGPDSATLTAHIDIFNNTSTLLDITCHISSMNLAQGHSKYFCFGPYCYDTTVMAALLPVPTQPGKRDSLQAYLVPGHTPGADDIVFEVYDNNGTVSDTLTIPIHYNFTTTGINELKSSSFTLNTASPNPANNLTAIAYSFSSGKDVRLVFYDLLGSTIKEMKLQNRQGISIVETSSLPSGIYVYSLVIDGNPVVSKRLVVAHNVVN